MAGAVGRGVTWQRAAALCGGAVLLIAACGGGAGTAHPTSGDSGSSASGPAGTAAAPAPLSQPRAREAVLTPEDLGAGWEAKKLEDVPLKNRSPSAAGAEEGTGRDGGDEGDATTGDADCDAALLHPSGTIEPVSDARREFDQDGTGVSLSAEVTAYSGDGAERTLEQARALGDDCGGLKVPWEDGTAATFTRVSTADRGDETVGVRMVLHSDDVYATKEGTVDTVAVRVGHDLVTLSFMIVNGTTDAETVDEVTRLAAERLRSMNHP